MTVMTVTIHSWGLLFCFIGLTQGIVRYPREFCKAGLSRENMGEHRMMKSIGKHALYPVLVRQGRDKVEKC